MSITKKFKGKVYVQTPEIEHNNCTGCIAQYEDKTDGTEFTELCNILADEDYCQSNGGMIYKEKEK